MSSTRWAPSRTGGPPCSIADWAARHDTFVITTNVDAQFASAGMADERIFAPQGDYGLFQCSRDCHQRTYPNRNTIEAMLKDAKLRRITRYRYNNVPGDNGARNYYITRMNEDGTPAETWSPTFLPAKTPLDVYRCRHGIGYTVFEAERVGVASTLTAFVPLPTGDVTAVSVEATF